MAARPKARGRKPATSAAKKKNAKTKRVPLPTYVVAYVWARAAGRCEFPGCNTPLWMDALTTHEANVGKLAHIVGASTDGPRGDPVESPRLARDPSNIMLLCGTHHDLVDKKKYEKTYPTDLLRKYKALHETRIERLTAIADNKKSVPVLVEIPVGAYTLRTPPVELSLAIAGEGFYPDDTKKVHVDLNGMTGRDHDEAFWKEARERLSGDLARQLGSLAHGGPVQHISVFGFGPIPLLIFLGHLLDEKVAASVYNRVRIPQGWAWPKDGKRIKKFGVTSPSCKRGAEVGLMLSVTSQVQRAPVKKIVPATMPIFELDWADPSLDCLRTPEELADFVAAGRNVMEQIHRVEATKLHVFAALPVACAVEFGRLLQKKLHPELVLYDFHQASGGWKKAFELSARAT